MLMRCFQRDLRCRCFGETSALSGNPLRPDDSHRLREYEEIEGILRGVRARLVVAKPLVDSQNAVRLLDRFPGSRAIWLYRDYRDVARSHVEKWGDGVRRENLRVVVEGAPPGHWLVEGCSADARDRVRAQHRDDLPAQDAAALFWYVRNRLFFDLGLDADERVLLCNYDRLVGAPRELLRLVYRHIRTSYPGDRVASHVHARSVRRGRHVALSPAVEALCRGLFGRLEEASKGAEGAGAI